MTDSERKVDFCIFCGRQDHMSDNHPRIPGPHPVPRFCQYCGVETQKSAGGVIAYGKHKEGCQRLKGAAMTKPADSDQIAKAREHMREFWRKSGHDFNESDIEKLCDDAPMEIDHWASLLASERQAVIEDCAKIAEDPANREPGWSLSTQRMIARAIRSME